MAALVDYDKAKALLDRYKIKSVKSKYIKNAEDAISFSNGSDIVLKVISQKALHKSKSGLVILGLRTEPEIKAAYNKLAKKALKLKPYKIQAQKMVSNGIEIIIGGSVDVQFGKMILLGLGGIYVETFRDFALRLCPITRYDALCMINQLKSKKVIAPDKKNEELIVNLLLKTSKMFENNSFSELDLNPIILHDNTYDAVDLRLLK
jgi:succinyl-CoA synthetase beta subunit